MEFQLPKLPYAYDALEPYIDETTLKVHHDGHHKAYVEKLNLALQDYPELQRLSLEELMTSLKKLPPAIREEVRNNGGGHFNHSLLWQCLTPPTDHEFSWQFESAFQQSFGGFPIFREKFSKVAEKLFGSGYVWLCASTDGKLGIESLPDQDCPLSLGLLPLLPMDLWEHAYYLKHQNRRSEYIEAFWKVVNWEAVDQRYLEFQKHHFKLSA
jgi:Fe-Mn family superoxide dismutase